MDPTGEAPVRQHSLRAHNLGLVLRHVAVRSDPVSRADVAAATGLTRATVSSLVDQLLAGRLLTEVDPVPRSGAGRPAVGLRLCAQGLVGLGLEVNVDYLAAGLVDLTGTLRRHTVRAADQRDRPPWMVLDDLAELAGELRGWADAAELPVAGAALAVPGLVADGLVRLAPNLGWLDLDLTAELATRPGLSGLGLFTVDNEANLAALAELSTREAAARGPSPRRPSFLYVSGEIGIGAGIVIDGQLFRGARGFGGELGHVTIRPDGPRCRCGARGCLEAYANQEAILREAGLTPGPGAMAELAGRARADDPAAVRALRRAGSTLGVAAATVVNLLDVDTVILGGAYAPLAPWLAPAIQRETTERVLTAGWAPVTVEASVLAETATVVGAAGSVVRAVLDAPGRWLTAPPFGPQ